jgi:hypothetical protein
MAQLQNNVSPCEKAAYRINLETFQRQDAGVAQVPVSVR